MANIEPYGDGVIEGEVLNVDQDCELGYRRFCTNTDIEWRYDHYESDVNNNPGQYVYACEQCYDEYCLDI